MTLVFFKQYFPQNYLVEDFICEIQVNYPNKFKFILFGFDHKSECSDVKYVAKGCSDTDYLKIFQGNPVLFFYERISDEFNYKVSGIAIEGISLGCSIFAPNKGFFVELFELIENRNTVVLYENDFSFIKIADVFYNYLNSILRVFDAV